MWGKLFGLCGVVPLALGFSPAAAQEPAIRPAKVFEVAEVQDIITRSYPAVVLPSREAELSFRVSGQVIELPIRAALELSAGDLIAKLDTRDFEAQVALLQSQIDQATAELDALRTGARAEEVAALEAAVSSAQAQFDAAQEALARTEELRERGVVTNVQLEDALTDFRVAEANLRAQEEQLRIGQAGGRPEEIVAAEAALRGLYVQVTQAQDSLADASLLAPFDGIVARRDIENFTNVQAGSSIALLQSLSPAHLAFDIPGADVTLFTRLGVDNITTVARFDSYADQEFATEIVEFSVQADGATQTYRGRVSVDIPPDRAILPGMVANVVVRVDGGPSETRVPLAAVGSTADGSPFVWLVDEAGRVSATSVTLGGVATGMIEVTEGVTAGDVVVAAGVSRLTAGQVIRPITQVGN